jgi:predicted glutamine amidotransferase
MPTAGESPFFEGRGTRVFLDPQPSCVSPVAELVRSYPIHSKNVIAHIRKATQGGVALENTHPFMRELWGRYWIFAHNGNLPDFSPPLDGSFTPVGQTDSERAFCWLLQNLRQRFGSRPRARTRVCSTRCIN